MTNDSLDDTPNNRQLALSEKKIQAFSDQTLFMTCRSVLLLKRGAATTDVKK